MAITNQLIIYRGKSVKTSCLLGSLLFALFFLKTLAFYIIFNHTYLSQMAFKLKEQKHALHSIKP